MKELAKHIEVLLLENDCVIVPGFGGFIAYSHSAVIDREKQVIFPPMRSLGFNPQLLINDGLLVQSYMQAYHTDFPDATRKIEETVYHLKDTLHNGGECHLPNIGTIYYNISGVYEFKPAGNYFFTPLLYGMETLPLLEPLEKALASEEKTIPALQTSATRRLHPFIKYGASAAAAVCFFFLFSTRVDNTQVDRYEYASLGTGSFISAIKEQSMVYNAPTVPTAVVRSVKATENKAPLTPKPEVAERVVISAPATVASAPEQTVEVAETVKYHHIIAASLARIEDAQAEVERLSKIGFRDAKVLSSGKMHRVSVGKCPTSSEAYKRINEIRQGGKLTDLWVLAQ